MTVRLISLATKDTCTVVFNKKDTALHISQDEKGNRCIALHLTPSITALYIEHSKQAHYPKSPNVEETIRRVCVAIRNKLRMLEGRG